MTKEQLIEFLKENLCVELDTAYEYNDNNGCHEDRVSSVRLVLGGEIISESYF